MGYDSRITLDRRHRDKPGRANTSPILKLFLSRVDEPIARVGKKG